jgi:uncharacterized protein
MEQKVTLLTIGVTDLARSTAFFEQLGWRRSFTRAEGVSFFHCGLIVISLFPRSDLAKDAGISAEGTGFSGIAIAYNTRSRDEVDTVLAEAKQAGGEIVKPAQEAFWGGYSGYFRDLDGHLWEIAWNPGFPFDENGALILPG